MNTSTSMPSDDAKDTGNQTPNQSKPRVSKLSIGYDLVMLLLISVDLIVIVLDALLMSSFITTVFGLFDLSLQTYQTDWHPKVELAQGAFTIFLIVEILARWLLAIVQKRYFRWFFFPFVHWYEVLSCFPQLRALRLLRVVVTGYRLYQLNIRFLPESWVSRGAFYYSIVLEEVSDRINVTALSGLQKEIKEGNSIGELMEILITEHKHTLARVGASVSETLTKDILNRQRENLTQGVSRAVYDALRDVPELKRYLRLIPVAGRLIESELQKIGSEIGERIASELIEGVTASNSLESSAFFAEVQREIEVMSVVDETFINELRALSLDVIGHVSREINKKEWKMALENQ